MLRLQRGIRAKVLDEQRAGSGRRADDAHRERAHSMVVCELAPTAAVSTTPATSYYMAARLSWQRR